MNWYLKVLKNYAGFDGRARRTEYWMFALFNIIIIAVLEILFFVTRSPILLVPLIIYVLAVLVPGIAVVVRRLHDIGKSGGWFFITFVPFIGGIWLLVLMCTAGNPGPNMYGPDPKAGIAAY